MAPGLEGSTRSGRAMGSRRIFAPQFKLQVLDSYRKDADCRGNQRATARKYGIHRRQIQKWLQVEASLRTAVEVAAVPELPALNLARQRDDRAEATCQAAEPHNQKGVRVSLFPSVRVEEEGEVSDDDEPLDFTCATLSKRRSFSLQFKLEVLDAFHSDKACHGNQRATARKFGINRRQVQKWLGQEVELRGEAAYRGGLYRQRLGRWPDSEEGKNSDTDQCWDLSNKKRKAEPIIEIPQYKKPCRVEDVTSSVNDDYPTDIQETALCLVKVERQDEDKYPKVSSSLDKLPTTPSPPAFLLPPHSLPMGTFVPPPGLHLNMVNLYQGLVGECKVFRHSYDCYHDDCHHYHPRNFRSWTESMQEGRSLVAETPSEIKQRYEDTCLVIFKEQQQSKHSSNFLTFGTSRRTYEHSNNGNSSIIVRKPDEQKSTKSQVCVLL